MVMKMVIVSPSDFIRRQQRDYEGEIFHLLGRVDNASMSCCIIDVDSVTDEVPKGPEIP